IQVLDRADDYHVVCPVTHHFQLVLLPTQDAALDEHFTCRRLVQTTPDYCLELVAVVRHTAASAAQGEGGPDYRREAGLFSDLESFLPAARHPTTWDSQADALHRFRKERAVLCHLDRTLLRPDKLHSVALQYSALRQLERHVKRRLATHRGQQRVRALLVNNELHVLGRHRLDVRPIRDLRIGHDRCRVGVDEDYLVPL